MRQHPCTVCAQYETNEAHIKPLCYFDIGIPSDSQRHATLHTRRVPSNNDTITPSFLYTPTNKRTSSASDESSTPRPKRPYLWRVAFTPGTKLRNILKGQTSNIWSHPFGRVDLLLSYTIQKNRHIHEGTGTDCIKGDCRVALLHFRTGCRRACRSAICHVFTLIYQNRCDPLYL